jgi:Cu+-exporting ATPase
MEHIHHGAAGDAQVRDPVCGMTVDPEKTPHHHTHEGKPYHFCSAGCLAKFRQEPDRYLTQPEAATTKPAPPPAPSAAAPVYTCPMHPEVRSDRPGFCPKCGMALEPLLGAGSGVPGAAQRTEWTCPMHPEIVRDKPGNCPICGMALEPRTVTAEEQENPELRDMTRRFWVSALLSLPLTWDTDRGGTTR